MARAASEVEAAGRALPRRPRRVGHMKALYATIATALILAGAAAVIGTWAGPHPDPAAFAVAVAAFAGSQMIRLRVPIGRATVFVGWVEVGCTAVLCLVPAVWAPVVVLLGAVIALGYPVARGPSVDRAPAIGMISGIVMTTTAGAAAATVTVMALGGVPGQPIEADLQRPTSLLPLVASGTVQLLFGVALTAVWLASLSRERTLPILLRIARAKRPVMLATAAVAAATAVLVGIDWWWLVALTPVLWAFNLVYEHQIRTMQDRRTWATLADATRSLNQLDESGVALAALRGAARLFATAQVEVELVRPQGVRRTYRAKASDLLSGNGMGHMSTVDSIESSDTTGLVGYRLTVGGADLGEIRLGLRPGARLSESEKHALSTFAGAAASAFHDASTHRRLQAMTARSAYDALYDTLTGLPNRSTLLARGNEELRTAPEGALAALVLLDVADLRQVNDSLGYSAGDELLQVVARRLMERQVQGELIGRIGGDEFAMLIVGAPPEAGTESRDGDAVDRARFVAAELAAPTYVQGVPIAVEVCAGFVVEPASAGGMGELLRRADVALHQAKADGHPFARYDAAQDAFNTDRLALLADIRDALSSTNQFVLHVQPVVDLSSGQPIGAEALIRWHHPRRGLLQPADFIATIEHSDLASAFTAHVIDMALRLLSGWVSQGIDLPISVNLCGPCTLNPDLPAVVTERLRHHGIPARSLIMEISESVAMAEQSLAEQVVKGLRTIGVQVSVDDFGTGAASFSFLARFQVDEVKIDRTFVATMVESPETAAIVRTTVEIAKDLGLRVVAEGVERSEQRSALALLGVTAAQGFLFHKPMPVDEATLQLQGLVQSASARHIPIVRAPA